MFLARNFPFFRPPSTILFLAFLGLIGLWMYRSQRHFSPVYDELANIPSGFNLLETGRYPDATHPPLLRFWMAAPLPFLGADALAEQRTGATDWKQYGRHFLFENKVGWQRILGATRGMTILLALGLLAVVFVWSRRLFGNVAAWAATIFLAFEPSFLAHGQLATLDMGFALTYFLAAWALFRYLEKPEIGPRFWQLVAALGVAFLSKFAAIPIFFAVAAAIFFCRKKADFELKKWFWAPLVWAVLCWSVYLFQIKSPAEDTQLMQVFKPEKAAEMVGKIDIDLEAAMQTPVPAWDFFKGFGMQIFHAAFQEKWSRKDSFQFLLGAYEPRGWRTYFLWTFLLKSTLATLVLIGWLALVFGQFFRKKASFSPLFWSLLLPPLFLFVACSLGTINIGHRYILPVYPFLAMSFGFLAQRFDGWKKRFFWLMLAAHMVSSAAVWPHHLAYFNEFSRGDFYLADSNLDWGQDLLFVQKDLEKLPSGTTVWGDFFGIAQPKDLGIELKKLPKTRAEMGDGPHVIYFSAHRFLNRSAVNPAGIFPFLSSEKPTRTVGRSILVFEF